MPKNVRPNRRGGPKTWFNAMTKADVRSAKSAQEKPEVVFGEGDLVRVTVVSGRPVRRVTKVDLGGLAIYVQGLCGSYSWSVLELVERAKKPD